VLRWAVRSLVDQRRIRDQVPPRQSAVMANDDAMQLSPTIT